MPNTHELLRKQIVQIVHSIYGVGEDEFDDQEVSRRIVEEVEKEIIALQKIHRDSTEPMSAYFRGMYNGMEVLRSCLIGNEPVFVDPELKAQGLEE